MKINKEYDQIPYKKLKDIIMNHKKYADFNIPELYQGILYNEKLNIEQKIDLRDLANEYFPKTFNFLQRKAPRIYYCLVILGEEEYLTEGDKNKIWEDIIHNREKMLKAKKG